MTITKLDLKILTPNYSPFLFSYHLVILASYIPFSFSSTGGDN